jgi:predicted lipid-binding transport protein (Tim44 family)
MSSAIAVGTSRVAQHARTTMTIAAAVAALTLGAGCVDDRNQPSNQTTGTVLGGLVGGAVGGLAFGSVGGVVGGALVGALAGNLVGRALDNQERARLAQATQQAFVAQTNQPTTYTVEPTAAGGTASGSATATNTTTGSAQPTVVSAKPVGPATTKTDGSTCRPIELTATKNGQTNTQTTTFCQSAGSTELKPVSV